MAKVCVIGSGAGAAPVIYELSKAGHQVVVLEKGPWIHTDQFNKDVFAVARRDLYIPNVKEEYHELEQKRDDKWKSKLTNTSGRELWNGSAVGGSSNFMSGYFHRMKPTDFRLLSTYGDIAGANVADWPISYDDLEPYYAKVESMVGISGEVRAHSHQEPRSTPDFPYPPLAENRVANMLDDAAKDMGYDLVRVPRAILSQAKGERKPCYYSNFCGSFGCSSDAKGSARVALLRDAVATGSCEIIPFAKVYHLETDGNHNLQRAWYYDHEGSKTSIEADIFVVACQAMETSRLLLSSVNDEFPNGLANNSGQVGRNLIFSGGGAGSGYLIYDDFDSSIAEEIATPGLWVNRAIQNWYEIEDPYTGKAKKGGTVDFVWEHGNPMMKAMRNMTDSKGHVRYGRSFKAALKNDFTTRRRLRFEVFADWLPTDDCRLELSKNKDKWGDPVGKLRVNSHERDREVGSFLCERATELMENLGAKNVSWGVSSSPSTNLQAGGCRFGEDPAMSVLDANCQAHEVSNLYVTDGSFMPTGGSVTFTWTIYANSFRVADHLLHRLNLGAQA